MVRERRRSHGSPTRRPRLARRRACSPWRCRTWPCTAAVSRDLEKRAERHAGLCRALGRQRSGRRPRARPRSGARASGRSCGRARGGGEPRSRSARSRGRSSERRSARRTPRSPSCSSESAHAHSSRGLRGPRGVEYALPRLKRRDPSAVVHTVAGLLPPDPEGGRLRVLRRRPVRQARLAQPQPDQDRERHEWLTIPVRRAATWSRTRRSTRSASPGTGHWGRKHWSTHPALLRKGAPLRALRAAARVVLRPAGRAPRRPHDRPHAALARELGIEPTRSSGRPAGGRGDRDGPPARAPAGAGRRATTSAALRAREYIDEAKLAAAKVTARVHALRLSGVRAAPPSLRPPGVHPRPAFHDGAEAPAS